MEPQSTSQQEKKSFGPTMRIWELPNTATKKAACNRLLCAAAWPATTHPHTPINSLLGCRITLARQCLGIDACYALYCFIAPSLGNLLGCLRSYPGVAWCYAGYRLAPESQMAVCLQNTRLMSSHLSATRLPSLMMQCEFAAWSRPMAESAKRRKFGSSGCLAPHLPVNREASKQRSKINSDKSCI